MTGSKQKELAGRVALLVMPEEALAEALKRTLLERGAEVHWIDSKKADWAQELDAFPSPVDVLVHLPSPVASSEAALESTVRTLDSLRSFPRRAARRGFGRMIHLTSLAAEREPESGSVATLANRVVAGETHAVALGFAAQGVTVNRIAMGRIEGLGQGDAHREEVLRHTPMRRAGTLQEVAEAVAFLASPRAGFITGVTLPVCGGLGLGLYPEQFDGPRSRA